MSAKAAGIVLVHALLVVLQARYWAAALHWQGRLPCRLFLGTLNIDMLRAFERMIFRERHPTCPADVLALGPRANSCYCLAQKVPEQQQVQHCGCLPTGCCWQQQFA
jgi:hypothetical protein